MSPRLSKSRFIAGTQCPLRLWYSIHAPELATEPDDSLQAVFEIGHRVGELAQQRWPGGVLVDADHRDIAAAEERTRTLMANPAVRVLYEPAISHDNVLTRVDILVRAGDAWDLIEVKSSTQTKPHFELDVAVQYWILVGAGIPVRRAGLLLLDRDYIYPGGHYDLEALFCFEDLTDDCREQQDAISAQVGAFHALVAQPEPPDVAIGDHCHKPYDCAFWNHCTAEIVFPEYPITLLPHLRGGRLDGLVALGIESVPDIPDDYPLTELQQRVYRATRDELPWVSPALRSLIDDVAWPRCFLDFEAASFALPQHPGMRPYDQLPFQFSCHIQHSAGGALEHAEFLAMDAADPREALARALLTAVGTRGSIVVYSGYELRTIRALAAWLPQLSDKLLALEARLVDLLEIIRGHYYHPGFRGSFSIKQVLPVLAPGMTYEGMAVADGTEAGRVWLEMIASNDPAARQRQDAALRAYCQQDSLAMWRLLESLTRHAREA